MIMDTVRQGNVVNFPTMPKKLTFTALHRLRELRTAAKLNLDQVAPEVGATTAQLSRLEVGTRELTLHWLKAMARFYEIPPADVLLPSDGGLSAKERQLIDTIREIPAPLRETFWHLMESHQHLRGAGEIVPLPAQQA